MDGRALDDWLEGFMELTENTEPARLYRLWVGVSTIAAALQRKCHIAWGPYTFYPNMYIVLVGPSGAGKGTAMAPGYRLLSDIGIKMAAQSTTLPALIRRLSECTSNKQDPKTGKLLMHSSLTVFSDELVVFLGYQEREMLSALCDWFDCKDRWTYDTKNKGTDEVLGVWVNLLGATTPALIQSNLPIETIGGGLSSRIIFVYANAPDKLVPSPFLTSVERDLHDDLRNDLEKIHLMAGGFQVTEGFVDRWVEWYTDFYKNPPKHLTEDYFGGYIQRRKVHLIKLSMILSASSSSDMIIHGHHFDRANRLLIVTEQVMPHVFKGVGKSPISDILSKVIGWISLQKEVGYGELIQRFQNDADDMIMTRVVKTLEQMKYIQREVKQGGRVVLHWTGEHRKPPS